MNRAWAEKNKNMQSLIGKEKTFPEGVEVLLELRKDLFEQIAEFSKKLDVEAVYEYARAVMNSTNELLKNMEYKELKRKFTDADKEKLSAGKCVSTDENAFWLIDYWCGKDVKGLIKMPFSRHWIMHIEAMCRIESKLSRKANK